MISQFKAWLCAHGIHWYTWRKIYAGQWKNRVCRWCGHIPPEYYDEDDYDDFGGSGGFKSA